MPPILWPAPGSASPFVRDQKRPEAAGEINAFNELARATANSCGVPFLDWTPLSRSFAGRGKAFAQDGLHPAALQHAAWADHLAEFYLGIDKPPPAICLYHLYLWW